MTWVSPQRLSGRWQPEMFRAEYVELDQFLENTHSLVPLKELVQLVRKTDANDNATWHVEHSGIKRRFPNQRDEVQKSLAMPEEAVLVSRNWFNQPSVRYWNSSVYRGNGSVSDNYFVLAGAERGSIAWLVTEFESPYFQLQLKRRAIGETLLSVSDEDFLDIRVKVPPLQVQSQMSRSVIEDARHSAFALRIGRIQHGIELSGESHEERLNSLEHFLVEQQLFRADDIFYVEPATSNPLSDLFTVRSGESGAQHLPRFIPQDDPSASAVWRDWFWNDTPTDRHKIFNSLLADAAVPAYLLMHTVKAAPPKRNSSRAKTLLPSFSTFRNAVLPSLEADVGVEDQVWADTWLDLQESLDHLSTVNDISTRQSASIDNDEQAAELFAWSRRVYRPILAVRVLRDDKVVGAYLLVGKEQVNNPESVYAALDDIGVDLTEALSHGTARMDEVLRRESARRLSEVMHRLSGPILNATDALQNISDFLATNADIANQLVPDEHQAHSLAEMNRDPTPDAYRLISQVATIGSAVEQIRNIAQRIKTLARVEEHLVLEDFSLRDLFAELRTTKPWLSLSLEAAEGNNVVHADRDLIYVAIELVIDNSVRELREQHTIDPRIVVQLKSIREGVEIRITDNALPVDLSLRHDVFNEGVSTYFRANKGSGYGLAIVRRTFERHGSKVSLDENRSELGIRLPGVTFRAVLPRSKGTSDE